jgi:hypothetical protein
MKCRAVFEAERAVAELGALYGALADLEDEIGNRADAVRFVKVALRYVYQTQEAVSCAIGHNKLASYLRHGDADPATILAHRLAAAAICLQTRSGELQRPLTKLAGAALPPVPPSFAEIAERVESVEGVHFQALFERLPRTEPDGDAAIAAVWKRLPEEQRRQDETMTQILREHEPQLQAIAAGVKDARLRGWIESGFAAFEQMGWHLTDAARRIWAGERDAESLTARIDTNSARLVRRVLEILEQREQSGGS